MSPRPPDHEFCADVIHRLDDYVDRALDERELAAVEAHLAACLACAREYEFERQVLARVRDKLARIQAPAGMLERVRQVWAKRES